MVYMHRWARAMHAYCHLNYAKVMTDDQVLKTSLRDFATQEKFSVLKRYANK